MERRSSEPLKLFMEIVFDSDVEADRIGRALRVDDDDFVSTRIEGVKVLAEIRGDSILSIKRSADDWMACLMAAARVVERKEPDLTASP